MIATLRESKARLSEFVQLASRGEDVLITVRGTPKARLVPVGGGESSTDGWMEELASLRESIGAPTPGGSSRALEEVREDRW